MHIKDAIATKQNERYGRIDVTDEAVTNEFNCIEQICIRFSFRANFFRPPSKMPSRPLMCIMKHNE